MFKARRTRLTGKTLHFGPDSRTEPRDLGALFSVYKQTWNALTPLRPPHRAVRGGTDPHVHTEGTSPSPTDHLQCGWTATRCSWSGKYTPDVEYSVTKKPPKKQPKVSIYVMLTTRWNEMLSWVKQSITKNQLHLFLCFNVAARKCLLHVWYEFHFYWTLLV